MGNYKNNIMKPNSKLKTIVVKLTADNISEFDIDVNVFDDPFMEAATRAIEKTKTKSHGVVRPVAECWDKNSPKKTLLYNSYWLLVNAACYSKAELLREKFRMQTDHDLSKEPMTSKKL